MKKTLIATAIAASMASFAVSAADAKIYGNIQLALPYADTETESSYGLEDNGSTIGIKGSHEIAPGLKGFFKAELEFAADDKAASKGLNKLDEAYIGVEGGFGKVWVGSDDTVYEQAININDYFEYYGISDLGGTGEGDMIQYSSPSFSGLKVHAGVQINGEDDDKGKGEKSNPYVLVLSYDLGETTTFALGMDSNEGKGSNENAYGLSVSQKLGDLTLQGQFETQKDAVDKFGVLGIYTLGNNAFALGYEMADADKGDETNTVLVQALHNLSDNMYVYVEGLWEDTDLQGGGSEEGKGVVLGATYQF